MSQFGKKRLNDFYVDPTYVNVNHASYGYVPKVVIQYKKSLMERCQFNTQKWFRIDAEVMITELRGYVASKINCKPQNVFFIQNATDGINCILKSFNWKEGDVVLLPNTAYACVRKTVTSLKDRYNITILDINFTIQDLRTPENYQLAVQNVVNSYPRKIRFAIFDHISSVPGIICPVDTLQEFFKQKGIPLFIDGAHAINHIDVNMAQINPAAYFSNFHKWAFAPKNAAFIYISDQFLNIIRPVLTGNHYGMGPQAQFFWTGTRDFTSYLSVRKGIQYSESFGVNKVRNYNHNLVIAASKRIAEIWKTSMLTEDVRCIGNLANIQVPCSDPAIASKISMEMLKNDNCFPVFFQFGGKIWTRISAQLYNELSDYEYMANTVLAYLSKYQNKEKP